MIERNSAETATPQNLNPTEQVDLLWKAISRFDFYIGSVNAKSAIIVAFNTFVVSGLALKYSDILKMFGQSAAAQALAALFLTVAAVAAICSLVATFLSISPYLRSPRVPLKYHSCVFFGHVAEHESPEQFLAVIRDLDQKAIARDLSFQAHALAVIANSKFKAVKWASRFLVWAELPALATILVIKLVLILLCVHS